MYITKEQFDKICKKYNLLLIIDSNVADALSFVQELLEAEADAIKEHEPYAVESIERLNKAAYEIFDLRGGVENEEFFKG